MKLEQIYEGYDYALNLFPECRVFFISGFFKMKKWKNKQGEGQKKRAKSPFFVSNLKFYYSDLSESMIIGVEPSEIIILVFGDFESSWKTSKLFHSMF